MSEDYSEQVYVRHEKVEGVGPWVWPILDSGAWIGPSEEFSAIRTNILTFVKPENRQLIITAGGCCGMYPRLWAEVFPLVYTFEPFPLNWYCLNQNCPEERIVKYNAAVGEHLERVIMEPGDKTNMGTHRISYLETETSIMVEQISIDSLKLPRCDVIQLDIEGYEPPALLGASETIAKYRPVIALETRCHSDANHAILEGWGYKRAAEVRNDTIFVPIEIP